MEQDRQDGVPARDEDSDEAWEEAAWEVIKRAQGRAACVSALPVANEQRTRSAFPATGWPVRVAARR